MLQTLYLIRHGEVDNPRGVVYADLPGFGLSPTGIAQAEEAARRLSDVPLDAVVSSPLDRARQTADPIARAHGLDVVVDERLTEWAIARRWADTRWDELPVRFPGELEAYLEAPDSLPFSPEQISGVAQRMAEALAGLDDANPEGTVAIVSHQDPVQAIRLRLTGVPLSALNRDKPGHATVITMERRDAAWEETARWDPEAGLDGFPPVDDREAT